MNNKTTSTIHSAFPPTRRNPRPLLRAALIAAAYLILFIILDMITQQFEVHRGVVAWYPPAGLTYTLLLVFGLSFVPAVTIALFIGSLFIYRMPQAPYMLLLWAIGVSLIYGAAALFLRKRIRFDWHLQKLWDVTWLVVTTVFVSALLAILSVPGSALSGALPRSEVLPAVFHWWIGETVGVLTVTPFLLVHVMPVLKRFAEGQPIRWPTSLSFPRPTLSAIGQVSSIVLTLYWVFGASVLNEYQPLYLIVLPIIWIALQRGFKGVITAILALNSGVVIALWLFRFDLHRLGELELVMIVNCIVGLLVGAVVTERKRAEDTLLESEKRFRTWTENSSDLITVVGSDGTIQYESPSIELLLGYKPEELIGTNAFDMIHPDDRQQVMEIFTQNTQKAGNASSAEFRLRHRDGSWRVFEGLGKIYLNEQDQVTRLINSRDVTERKQSEQALSESEDNFKHLFDHSIIGISFTLPSGEINVNQAFCDMLGYSQEELQLQRWQDITHPDDVGLTQSAIDSLLSGEKNSTRFDKRYIHKSGAVVWVELGTSLRWDKTGKPLYLVTALNDITWRKQQELEILTAQAKTKQMLDEANQSRRALLSVVEDQRLAEQGLRESEERFRTWTENSSDLITVVGLDGTVQYESPSIEHLLGYKPEELVGTNVFDLIHPDDRQRLMENLGQFVQKAGNATSDEFRLRHRDGSWRLFESLGKTILDEQGQMTGLVNSRDITERKRMEAERQSLLEIMQGVAATGSLQELLELIRQSLARVIYAGNFFVVIFNKSSGLFEEVFAVDKYDAVMPPSKLERSITSYVFRTGQPLLLSDAKFEELVARGEVDLIGTNSAAFLAAPLKTPSQTIGVMAVQNYEDADCYSERDREFLASVAMQVALVIDRKRAEEEITKQVGELQRWNAATLGREMRVLDLKREVNEFLAQAGQPPRYPSVAMEIGSEGE